MVCGNFRTTARASSRDGLGGADHRDSRMDARRPRMLLEHEGYYALGMDALLIACIQTWTLFCFEHGCSGNSSSWNTNIIMLWAWMLR